jgi:tape measure domain-containing protein
VAKSVQIASVFTAIGFKVNKKDLDRLQKQLGNLKKQLRQLQGVAKLNINPNTQRLQNAHRELVSINKELAKIKNKAINVNVKRSGGAGGAGVAGVGASRATGGRGPTARGVAGGAFAGSALAGAGQFSRGAGAVGISAFAGAGIFQATANIEGIKVALLAVTGSAKQADEQFDFLNKTTEDLGVNFLQSAKAFRGILAAGVLTGFGVEKSQELFTAVASASRVLNLSADDTAGALRAVQQMLQKGKVSSEELRQQLAERLPFAMGAMEKATAKMLGKQKLARGELDKMLEQGELLAQDVLPFFSEELLKVANSNGALARSVKSPLANLERLKKSFLFFQNAIGSSYFVFELSKAFLDLTGVLKGSSVFAQNLGFVLSTVTNVFRAAVNIIGTIITGLSLLNPWLLATAALIILMNFPILILIAKIGLVILAIDDLISFFTGKESIIGHFFENIGKKITSFVIGIRNAIAIITGLFDLFKNFAVERAMEFIDPVIDFAKKGIEFFTSDEGKAAADSATGEAAGVPGFDNSKETPTIELINTVTITEDLPKVETKVVNS